MSDYLSYHTSDTNFLPYKKFGFFVLFSFILPMVIYLNGSTGDESALSERELYRANEELSDCQPPFLPPVESVIPAVQPGSSFSVRMTPPRPGTFMYHVHSEPGHQLAQGLYGPFLVMEPGEKYDPETDRYFILGSLGSGDDPPAAVNGELEPDPLEFTAGETYRLRFMHISPDDDKKVSLLKDGEPVEQLRRLELPLDRWLIRFPESGSQHIISWEQRDAIKAELKEIRKQLYEALERGDCDTVVETFDENVTFYTTRGVRVPSTDVILNTCRNLPRPLPRPVLEEEEVHVISEDAAWTVHVMEFEPRNVEPGVIRREVVTLIWRKTNEGWRTVHFHASLNPVPEN